MHLRLGLSSSWISGRVLGRGREKREVRGRRKDRRGGKGREEKNIKV